ncbi:hypothetical protein K435DRAFT_803319 [Dendrothele bispora CBS 962.96]|uniref:Uncharacterized protein n=1 Tax=Dendrothele bispora (strain CBS 962.96) TaxID=1314807 RepID=A0A4S8LIJ6_DENBC|nr:hypothetical protein K435DRAFT_803319 [Dendrothele bispora CBS 962.96]
MALQTSFTHYDWQNVNVKLCMPSRYHHNNSLNRSCPLTPLRLLQFYSRHVVLRFNKCATLLTPGIDGRFFVVSTSLTRVDPIPRKGSEKGKGRNTRRNARRNLDLNVQWISRRARTEIRLDFQGNTKKENDYTVQGFTGNIYLTGSSVVTKFSESSPSVRISLAFYPGTSKLLNLVNNYKGVHADKRVIGAWREKTGLGPIQTTPGSSDKNKNKKNPDRIPEARDDCPIC